MAKAEKSVIISVVDSVKEELQFKYMGSLFEQQKITVEDLVKEGIVKRIVIQNEEGNYEFTYVLVPNILKTMGDFGIGNVVNGKDVFFVDSNFNVKYVDKDGNKYGDDLEIKILNDDTEIKFSSEAFSKYISKISGVTEDEMKFKWMKNQTSLIIDDKTVDSLIDLVFFPNLTTLTIKNLQLESLEGIEICANLTSFTSLSALSKFTEEDAELLSDCNELNEVYVKGLDGQESFENLIEGIKDKEKITILRVINSKVENIKKMEELSCANLRTLDLSGNNITIIEGLENFEQIRQIFLNDNDITSVLPLANIASIDKLNNLNLKNNPRINPNREDYSEAEITKLDKIGEILNRGTIALDINTLKLFDNYTTLSLGNQGLTDLTTFEGMTQLKSLDIQSNEILLNDEKSQNILLSMEKLASFNIQNNGKVNISVLNNLKNLRNLYISQKSDIVLDLKNIEDIISNLTMLRCNEVTFETITNCDVDKITTLNVSYIGFQTMPDLSKFTKLKTLAITNNTSTKYNIVDYSAIEKLSQLESLNLSNNDLHEEMIDLSKLTNLKTLNLSNNNLWSEELTNLAGLKNNTNMDIDLSNNSIIDATPLLELDLSTKINLKNNVNLSQASKDALTARFGSNVSY